ncbi:L-threonylcarbamoyladenylate synthase, partial [Mesotoga prima]|uniref:L-threonylcarbamoyladenylate synthase n=1 Tax=Mesotoga prima TaxID=1184387 RepID=UPI002C68F08E
MNTVYLRVNSEEPDEFRLKKAARFIREGELVVFPTETVYGLGANALDESAISKIYHAKGRPQDNPLIVHVSSREMVADLVLQNLSEYSALMDTVWPGPVTLIFRKRKRITDSVTAGLDTV